MTRLEIALSCIARGWHVFPCWPRSKKPMTAHGWHDASCDEAQIHAWWAVKPDANVAIACNQSNLAVLDIDHGLADDNAALAWLGAHNIPATYMVRTGRRPEFGLQIYFSDAIPDVGLFKLDGCEGQIKSLGGYVMAAGSIHPDSGKEYAVKNDAPLARTPDVVRALRSQTDHVSTEPGKKIPEGAGRHDALMRVACGMRSRGLDGDTIHEAMIPINPAMCEVPIPDEDLRDMCHGIERRYPAGELDEPTVTFGTPKAAQVAEPPKWADWRDKYHTFEQMDNAPEPVFLIDNWLQLDSITAIAAPVGQRKSLIALNVAWSLCSGQPLFDHFKVTKQPARVLYLCPEMGLGSFTKRLRAIGALPYVGKTLFCRTMSVEEEMTLNDLTAEELAGAVVIVDTAVRYLEGDENKSEDMRVFARSIFRLTKAGATVLLLHHSAKGTKEASELTLENAMRGSGELGAFLYCCWATRLQDPANEYDSASYLRNVKPRDFESKPFEVTSDRLTCRLKIVQDPETAKATLHSRAAFKGNKDGKDEAAEVLIKANAKLSNVKLSALLKDAEMPRSAEWIRKRKFDLLQANGGMMP